MKRNIINPILRCSRSSYCGKGGVTIPSSMNHMAKVRSIRALASSNVTSINICKNQVPYARGTSSSFTSGEKTTTGHSASSKSSSYFYGAVTAALGATVAFDYTVPTSRSLCDSPSSVGSLAIMTSSEADTFPDKEEEIPLLTTRPLWPGGVSEEDLDALVEIILEDPNINIQMVPDAIEAIIYKSTVKLVFNLCYRLLAKLNGLQLLSHQIQIAKLKEEKSEEEEKSSWFSGFFGSEQKPRESSLKSKYRQIADSADMKRSEVNDEVLNAVAARMLENQVVNNAYIPDAFEIYLYQSCLKVVFRALRILSQTFHINVCGHNIRILIEPSALEHSVLTAANGKPRTKSRWTDSDIDMKLLQEFAFEAGIPHDGYLDDENLSWWDRFWLQRRRKMIANLHASLFGLILGIVDDVLQHSSVKILSDDIFLDIAPAAAPSDSETNMALPSDKGDDRKEKVDHETKKLPAKSSSKFSFGAGMVVGAGLMFLVSSTK